MPTETSTSQTKQKVESTTNGRGDLRAGAVHAPDTHRMLPASVDAEQGLLSSFLLAPREVGGLCAEKAVKPEDFHVPTHALLYRLLLEMWDTQKPIDIITLTEALRGRNQLDQVGGPAFITQLFTFLPTAANAGYYLEIVEEKHTLREIIRVCTEYASRSYEEQDNVAGLLDDVEGADFRDRAGALQGEVDRHEGARHGGDQLHPGSVRAPGRHHRAGHGLHGFRQNDRWPARLGDDRHRRAAFHGQDRARHEHRGARRGRSEEAGGGLLPGNERAATRPAVTLLEGARQSRARPRRVLERARFSRAHRAASKLAESKIFIDDSAGISILELRAKARRLKSQHGIEAIFVDYLQLLRSTSRRAQDNRQIEIAEISSGLKALAKELAIPIVVLAQLNRNPEQRAGDSKGRPRLSDLRESGSIEQDADLVGLLVREEYYADNDEEKKEAEGKATLIIAKQRNGPVGDVNLTFLKEFTRFETRAAQADSDH